MKTLQKSIIVFVLNCLVISVNAQYERLYKNQRNPFDTAVAIQIIEYRKIRDKVESCDSLDKSQKKTIFELNRSLKHRIDITNLDIQEVDTYRDSALRKDSLNTVLIGENKKLVSKIEKENKWHNKPWIWGIVGLLGGVFIAK